MTTSSFSGRLACLAAAVCLLHGGPASCHRNATIQQPAFATEASHGLPQPGRRRLRNSARDGRGQLDERRGGTGSSLWSSSFTAEGRAPAHERGSSRPHIDGRRELDGARPHRDPTAIEGQVLAPEVINRCSSFDLSTLALGASCGEPLSAPCFDFSRCGGPSPTIYVYDRKVKSILWCLPISGCLVWAQRENYSSR